MSSVEEVRRICFYTFIIKTVHLRILQQGTAGLVVAARLTEDPNITVAVLEAGSNLLDDPLVNTPAAALQLVSRPDYDWMIQSVPQV